MADNELEVMKTKLQASIVTLRDVKVAVNSAISAADGAIAKIEEVMVKIDKYNPPIHTLPVEPPSNGLPGSGGNNPPGEGMRYVKIAKEYEQFKVNGTRMVRYGLGDKWVTKRVVGGGSCTNGFFGSDPVPGLGKVCEILLDPGETLPVVTPPPPPVVTPPNNPPVVTPPVTPPITSGPTWQPPIVITKGGVYSGAWASNDPKVPPVVIKTSEIVEIRGEVKGKGHLIQAPWHWVNLIIRQMKAEGLNPNDRSLHPGRFIAAEGIESVLVEDSSVKGTSGMYFNGWRKGTRVPNRTLSVLRILHDNVEGRYSDGNGGWQDKAYYAQFLQINNMENMPLVDVGWNRVNNNPNQSRPEDTINIHASTGTPASWMQVHHNLINGAFGSPLSALYSGGGIMLADSWGQWMQAVYNTVLETSNYGIAYATGNNGRIANNTVLGTGKVGSVILDADPDAGIYVRAYNTARGPRDPSTIIVEDNYVGWSRPKANNPNARWDWSIEPGMATQRNNVRVPTGPVTQAMLDKAKADWIALSVAQNQIPGFKN